MDKKVFVYGAVIVIVLILFLTSVGVIKFKSSSSVVSSSVVTSPGEMPEKCKLAQGYDLQSWKEHLGHHAETRQCLDYYK